MSDLFSKVLSGGVSAAIFLLWWPVHVPGDGPEWLVVRGLLWTLAFEVLMVSFCPLERAVVTALRERRAGTVTAGRLVRALALATAGLAVPAMLVAGAAGDLGAPEKASAAAPPKVIVKREIVRREVVVRRVSHVVRVPAASAPAPTRASAAAPAPSRAPRAAATTAEQARASDSSTRVVATTPKRQTPAAPTATKATPAAAPSTAAAKPTATASAPAATTATPAAAASSAPATAPTAGS